MNRWIWRMIIGFVVGILILTSFILGKQEVLANGLTEERDGVSENTFFSSVWDENPDMGELEAFLGEEEETADLTFTQLVKCMMEGDGMSVFSWLGRRLYGILFSEIHENAGQLRKVLVLAVFASLYLRLASGVVSSPGVGYMGFLVAYLMMAALILTSYQSIFDGVSQVFEKILTFMELLLPVFFVAVAYAGGTMTAMAFYELMLILIGSVEWALFHLFLPLTEIYVVLLLVSALSEENILSRLADLIRLILDWGMKLVVGIVIGMNLIQKMTIPLVDTVKNQSLRKLISAIPWVGSGADVLTQVVLGSGALLRNAIGTAAMLTLVLLCILPLVQLGLIGLLYQGAVAVVEPMAEKRLLSCIGAMSAGCQVLGKLVLYTLILFLISLAIVCSASQQIV